MMLSWRRKSKPPLAPAAINVPATYARVGTPTISTAVRPARNGSRRIQRQVRSNTDGRRAAILDLLSARWIVTPDPAAWLDDRYRRVSSPGAALAVFENPGALPRAYRVAGAAPPPPGLRAALQRLADPRFDPRRVALIEKPTVPLLRGARDRAVDPDARVTIRRYDPERVVLETRGRRPGVVVLTDAYFPGWLATLDGEEVPVVRANTAFRGVLVPPGEHVVEMRYEPGSLSRGTTLCAAAALGLFAAAVIGRRSRG